MLLPLTQFGTIASLIPLAIGLLIAAIVVLIALFALVAFAGAKSVSALRNVKVEPLSEDAVEFYFDKAAARDEVDAHWLAENGFNRHGVFIMPSSPEPAFIVAWERGDKDTTFCAYLIGERLSMDFVTMGSKGMLTTGSQSDGQFLPGRPLHYTQTFDIKNCGELWQRHTEGMAHLKKHANFITRPRSAQLQAVISESVNSHAVHVCSLYLWQLRLPFWYFVRRRQRHNVPLSILELDPM